MQIQLSEDFDLSQQLCLYNSSNTLGTNSNFINTVGSVPELLVVGVSCVSARLETTAATYIVFDISTCSPAPVPSLF